MANINDYIDWRGDLPINEIYKFNEIDSMILARFSYLIFDRIKMQEIETIESISNKMKKFRNEEFRFNGDKELITKLGISKRFKNLKVTDFVEKNEEVNEKQFGAITVHISEEELYVSYIGTDQTILGWKEDFNMSFMETVPCQLDGKDYLEKISSEYQNKKIRIGGHSKGGNVGIYASVMVSRDIQDRIVKVYNYDGPGFSNNFIESIENKEFIEKIETYIPQDSIIGRLMEHKEKCEVVKSIAKGIMQHDIYSWQVLKDDMVKLKSVTDKSELLDNTLTEWLRNTTVAQRKVFVDTIFDLFYSTNAKTFGEISKKLSANLIIILKKYQNVTDDEKKTINEMIKIFIKSYFSSVGKQNSNKIENIKNMKGMRLKWKKDSKNI